MRQRNLRLATLCLVTSWIAAVPVVGALSRDQHLDYDEELARLCVVRFSCSVTYHVPHPHAISVSFAVLGGSRSRLPAGVMRNLR